MNSSSRDSEMRPRWIYHLMCAKGRVLYVGTTCRPTPRIEEHRFSKAWWTEVKRAKWFYLGEVSAFQARRAEDDHIRRYDPFYNVTRPSDADSFDTFSPSGSTVRRLRLFRGLTQKDLALLSGVGEITISSMERGQHSPSATTIRKVAIALRVSTNDLWERRAS